jgi:glycosyltransferase involved in cell wall biosynthesis
MSYRVLVIAPTSFFLDYGCHVRILEEARILQKLGHRLKIVTYYMGRNIPGLDIERTRPIPFRTNWEVGSSRHKIGFDVLLSLKSLQTALRFKPQIIHAHLHEGALIGGVLSRLLRVPLVFDFQGSMTSEMLDHHFVNPRGKIVPLLRKLEGYIDRLPHAILTSSQNAARVLTEEFQVSASKIRVLSDCVNADEFARMAVGTAHLQELRTRLNIPPECKIVVYIGLLAEYRGTDVLLDAAVQLLAHRADTHFVIVGFPNIEKYQARARDLGIADRVAFPGRVPYEDVPLWLSLGNVAVEPKMSATEAAGKVLNYMAMGLPVIAFDIPVMREYLGDLGVYAPLGDASAFASHINALLDDPAHARRIGDALRERAREVFSWERAGREIERVYERVLR